VIALAHDETEKVTIIDHHRIGAYQCLKTLKIALAVGLSSSYFIVSDLVRLHSSLHQV